VLNGCRRYVEQLQVQESVVDTGQASHDRLSRKVRHIQPHAIRSRRSGYRSGPLSSVHSGLSLTALDLHDQTESRAADHEQRGGFRHGVCLTKNSYGRKRVYN
jgi:hypothetical protein